jgi:hypothetical protein
MCNGKPSMRTCVRLGMGRVYQELSLTPSPFAVGIGAAGETPPVPRRRGPR